MKLKLRLFIAFLLCAAMGPVWGNNHTTLNLLENDDDNILFYESFNNVDGIGGRDGVFSGDNVGTTSIIGKTDESGWWATPDNAYYGGSCECVKLGIPGNTYTLKTRSINLKSGTLAFNAAGWESGSNTLFIYISGGDFIYYQNGRKKKTKQFNYTLSNGQWQGYSIPIENGQGDVVISIFGQVFFLDDIKVTGEKGPAFDFTISSEATDGEGHYYATIADLGEGNFKVVGHDNDNVTVSSVVIDNGVITTPNQYTSGDVIDGRMAYLVESHAPGSYTFSPTTDDVILPVSENMLHSTGIGDLSAEDMASTDDMDPNVDYKYYKLSLYNNKIGFYYGVVGGEPFDYAKGHQAFLAVPTSETHGANAFFFDGTTNIANVAVENEETEIVYTLSGVRMDGKFLPKGIYIVNGQKKIIK